MDGVRRRVFYNALAFVIGFSIVFVLLGSFAAFLGALLGAWRPLMAQGVGLLVIIFGLTMLGVIEVPVLSSEKRLRLPKGLVVGRWESSLLIGALFSLGWSPCVGPILGTTLLVASTSTTALQGAVLLAVFSLGLGLPFLLTALLLAEAGLTFSRWGAFTTHLSKVGGVFLVVLGLVMLFGRFGVVIEYAYRLFSVFGYDRLLNYL